MKVDVGNKTIFETFIKHTDIIHLKIFLLNAKKYLLNATEFREWTVKTINPGNVNLLKVKEDDPIFNLYTPFKQIWCEFYEKEKSGFRVQAFPMTSGGMILGAGFDLDKNEIHAAVEVGDTSSVKIMTLPLDFEQLRRDSLKNEIMRKAVNLEEDDVTTAYMPFEIRLRLAKMSQYLQTEFVDCETKTFCTRRSMRRGKLIEHMSPYQVVYRKQPVQKTEHDHIGEGVDWQHRWHVRGHWRQIKGKGHDADGNEMEGWTWVKPCIKGPEDKPLVEKIKIVKDSLPPTFKRVMG